MRNPLLLLLFSAACGGASSAPSTAPAESTAGAPAAAPVVVSDELRARILTPDRSPEDQALDAGRKPAELVAFAGLEPGMKVADLAAGGGYTTEILVRAVGEGGRVDSQNSKMLLGFVGDAWDKRLAKSINKMVARTVSDFEAPLAPGERDLDAVLMVLFYHDLYWVGTDRAALNKSVFEALKPGGVYVVVDHSGRPGSGTTEVKTLHRIEESVVIADIEKAGFKLAAEADFLRNPSDTRDWNASPMAAGDKRGTSDRFVLKFVKP